MGTCVVAVGNAFDGINLFGPFEDSEVAIAWAEHEHLEGEWNVVDLSDRNKY
jgi:hypothetical protein